MFRLKGRDIKIIPSLQASYLDSRSESVVWSAPGIVFGNQIAIPPRKKTNADFSSGLLINYKALYVGGSVFHLTTPDMGLFGASKVQRLFCMNASYNITFNESTLLNLSAVIRGQQGYSQVAAYANLVLFKFATIGGGYQGSETMLFNVGYRGRIFSLTAGYDRIVSRLAGNHTDSYQVSMAVRMPKKTVAASPEAIETW